MTSATGAESTQPSSVGEDATLGTVLANAGYWSRPIRTETADCTLLIAPNEPPAARRPAQAPPPRPNAHKPDNTPTHGPQAADQTRPRPYRLRGQTVEPVFDVKEYQRDLFMNTTRSKPVGPVETARCAVVIQLAQTISKSVRKRRNHGETDDRIASTLGYDSEETTRAARFTQHQAGESASQRFFSYAEPVAQSRSVVAICCNGQPYGV